MSLNFGYSKLSRGTIPVRSLHYQTYFKAISKMMSEPYPKDSGFNDVIFCAHHSKDAKFTILTHTFDTDDTITTLGLRWIFKAYMFDGTTDTVDLADVDYSHSNVTSVNNTFFLNREFKFKDIFKNKHSSLDPDMIAGFYINFNQITNESYGNESVMSIVVDY